MKKFLILIIALAFAGVAFAQEPAKTETKPNEPTKTEVKVEKKAVKKAKKAKKAKKVVKEEKKEETRTAPAPETK